LLKPPDVRKCLLILAIVIASCSHQTPEQKLLSSLDPATSWIATLDFTAECWLGNRVPSAFVRASVSAAQKALDQAKNDIDSSKADPRLRNEARSQVRIADDAAVELNAAIHRSDRVAVARAKSRFAASYAALHALEEQQPQ